MYAQRVQLRGELGGRYVCMECAGEQQEHCWEWEGQQQVLQLSSQIALCLRSRSSACSLSFQFFSPCQADQTYSLGCGWLRLSRSCSLSLSPTCTLSNVALVLAKMHALSKRINREFRSVESFVECVCVVCVLNCCCYLVFVVFKGF